MILLHLVFASSPMIWPKFWTLTFLAWLHLASSYSVEEEEIDLSESFGGGGLQYDVEDVPFFRRLFRDLMRKLELENMVRKPFLFIGHETKMFLTSPALRASSVLVSLSPFGRKRSGVRCDKQASDKLS